VKDEGVSTEVAFAIQNQWYLWNEAVYLGLQPIDFFPWYHAATCVSPSMMHLWCGFSTTFPCLPIDLVLFLFTAFSALSEDYTQAFCTSVPNRAVVPSDSTVLLFLGLAVKKREK